VRKLPATILALILCAAVLPGCGGDDSADDAGADRAETAEPLPGLPDGWYEQVNERGGFAFGLPAGWSAQGRGPVTLALSPDGQVAVSISADRTGEALETPLVALARGVGSSLTGFAEIEISLPKRLVGHYPGVRLRASGHGGEKGDQGLEIVVLRRDGLAVFTILVARRSSVAGDAHEGEVKLLIASLRGRPPVVPG
jgi:hypothetical protein